MTVKLWPGPWIATNGDLDEDWTSGAGPRRLRRIVRGQLLRLGMAVDGFRPDRYDVAGALLRLAEAAVIMQAPRAD